MLNQSLWSVAVAAVSVLATSATAPVQFHQNNVRDAASAPVVDLGYARYRGFHNDSFDLHVYKGVRFAAPPKRWQLPESPDKGDGSVLEARDEPPSCPQSPLASPAPSDYIFTPKGQEDCLFLNVFKPANKTKLPVMVWIHGGGYGTGQAKSLDAAMLARTSGNGFMWVQIQYRLGAFGFASSAEIARFGVLNAGLHDVRFALEWVQKYIHLFGGDPEQVTIAGQSAGGGAVMNMLMANGGLEGTKLFKRALTSSPYLPTQWKYDGIQPSQSYYALAAQAGCMDATVTQNSSVFECLQKVDTLVLQEASARTSVASKLGQWAFIPVVDGTLIRERPTEQLLKGKVNGESILTGNNANEAKNFIVQDIRTEDDFKVFIKLDYPLLSAENITAIMRLYKIADGITADTPKFDSNGLTPPYATSVSHLATGWMQAARNLYAETTFVCPAYWLADAYQSSWRYQYSTPDAIHGADRPPLITGLDASGAKENGAFKLAFQKMYTNFIIKGTPNVCASETTADSDEVSAIGASTWHPWATVGEYAGGDGKGQPMLNLNITESESAGTKFRVVDGLAWEGGRGARCALWAELGAFIQE